MGSAARGFTASHSDQRLYSAKRSVHSSTGVGEGSVEPSVEASHRDQWFCSTKYFVRPATPHERAGCCTRAGAFVMGAMTVSPTGIPPYFSQGVRLNCE